MNKQELEAAMVLMKNEILRRDRLLRVCYYHLLQMHDIRIERLRGEMSEWAPQPNGIQPNLGKRYAK